MGVAEKKKNIIQIGEYIMMQSRRLRFVFSNHHLDLDIKIVHIAMDAYLTFLTQSTGAVEFTDCFPAEE